MVRRMLLQHLVSKLTDMVYALHTLKHFGRDCFSCWGPIANDIEFHSSHHRQVKVEHSDSLPWKNPSLLSQHFPSQEGDQSMFWLRDTYPRSQVVALERKRIESASNKRLEVQCNHHSTRYSVPFAAESDFNKHSTWRKGRATTSSRAESPWRQYIKFFLVVCKLSK